MKTNQFNTLSHFIDEQHGLILSSRTIDEIIYDINLSRDFVHSQLQSVERRKSKKYKSELVVETLDRLDDITIIVGNYALKGFLRSHRATKIFD